jgi:hypothetical protein
MVTKQAARNTQPAVEACGIECGEIATERNRYFTGKYLSDRDFADEQAYHISRHRLHNRILHGWGVVCGLRVLKHPNPDCDSWAVVRAGIAIDCCGRELVLRRDTAIDLGPHLPEQPPASPAQQRTGADGGEPEDNRLVVGLHYVERLVEYVPALYDERMCDPNHREANRVREVAELKIYKLTEFEGYPNEWPGTLLHIRSQRPSDAEQPQKQRNPCEAMRDDCDDELPGPAGICLEPECLLDDVVPLAVITPERSGEAWTWQIDMRNRPKLRTPPKFLTHIVDYNWPHGQSLSLSELATYEKMDGLLKIYFDRSLAETASAQATPGQPPSEPASSAQESVPEYGGTGINRSTFVVQKYNPDGIQIETVMLYDDDNPPYWDAEECAAVFPIHDEWLDDKDNIAGHIIHVTLKCDFVLDCHNLPVDGNHLSGEPPTGDGIEGGTFESWFRVVDDGANLRRLRADARRKRANRAATAGEQS